MILNKKNDSRGEYYRLGMIERQALTLENYASSEFSNRFYSDEYLKGLCERRNEIHRKVPKALVSLLVVTTLLAFFDSVEGTTRFAGFTFSVPAVGPVALCVIIAFNFTATIMAMIDQLLIDRFLSVLGQRLGIYSFELFTLNYSAQDLWVQAMEAKCHGLGSESGHKAVLPIAGLIFLMIFLISIAYPLSVTGATILEVLESSPSKVEVALIGISAFVWLFALLIIVLFSISYKFRPTGLAEPEVPFIPENFLDLGYPYRKTNTEDEIKGSEVKE